MRKSRADKRNVGTSIGRNGTKAGKIGTKTND